MTAWVLVLSFLLLTIRSVSGFANYMTHGYCHVPMEVGTEIMGQNVVESTARILKVFRQGSEVVNGSTVPDLSGVMVSLEPKIYQMVLECSVGVIFENPKCDGRRTNANNASITPYPAEWDGELKIRIVGAWANGYMEGVRLTQPFYFSVSPSTTGTAVHEL